MNTKKNKASYKQNFLDKVVLRLDFEQIELKNLSSFSTKIKGDFPFQEQKDAIKGKLEFDLKKNSVQNDTSSVKVWEFLSATRKKKLTISGDFIIIEYGDRSYKDKNELMKDCDTVIRDFVGTFDITTINRLGLRYINRVDLNFIKTNFNWSDYIAENLLGAVKFGGKTKKMISRAMTQLDLKYDEADLRFRYGIWNQDHPNENTRKEFILDYDCFSRFPLSSEDVIAETVRNYNVFIQDLFEMSIKPELRKLMSKK
ncbi:MAG: hypothetical protein UU88_C0001G0093 [Parcubacteria group bacterium GW2011_GWC1_42_11]|uniref:TIGR04255 family protein n=1 Tax=Candidatus Nomurabacteria bacterium GW2011_GWC2_42_20 TaxID=1618756 RepID=A0A0G0ZFX8_9BACT|nr:MAG: hypothetical protein UU88_C0001G0093 [Parcubacteria group bacterium GW2011_GWC1_42_11]KKS47602.1 MAG: hypothetical protein UV12_C0006G0026 [Candidatus Nomurabacteria bacterium GW2011_GWC2_42_20]KKS58729.1 MAG: hypothetical protein UV24_C0017G0008 [Candidatus Nomurabacteria bacterium GW2011_GWA2_42_41]KKT09534.1 MAG: hypothetical protein UV86_C0005G0005 [Candidatus Nomurabacteria bacterium GW2011_GWB1_43_20]TAN35937.1 MAG: TIGR04255 family protein [Patescibacteria group bacterium]HBH714